MRSNSRPAPLSDFERHVLINFALALLAMAAGVFGIAFLV